MRWSILYSCEDKRRKENKNKLAYTFNHLVIESKQSKEINDIWYALDYQDRRINKLVEENREYKEKLKYYEKKLDIEVRDIHDQIKGLKSNVESIVDIVKVINKAIELYYFINSDDF